MNKRFFLIANLLVLFVYSSFSQSPQLAGVSYVLYPRSGVKDESKPVEFRFQEFAGFIRVPYKFKNEKTLMVNGLTYASVNTDISNAMYSLEENYSKMQVIFFQSVIAQKLPSDFTAVISLRPTIASDFKEKFSANDFVMQGFLMVTKKKNENFTYGLGVVNTMRLGRTIVLPMIQIRLKNNKQCLEGVLPLKLNYSYSVGNNERLKVGLRGVVNGGNINISVPYTLNSSGNEIDKVNYSRANVGAVITYNITKLIQVEAFGGTSLRRQYYLLDVEDNKQKFYLDEVPFFEIGLFFAPHLKK